MVDGKYQPWVDLAKLCHEFEVPTAPVLYMGPYDRDLIVDLADGDTVNAGKSFIGGVHIREGVVIRPLRERCDPTPNDRVIQKLHGNEWTLNRHRFPDSH
jgi:hypothetical protein